MAKLIKLKDVKYDEFFALRLTANEANDESEVKESKVWVRGDYDRTTKRYACRKYDDVCHFNQYRGDRLVWVDFIF